MRQPYIKYNLISKSLSLVLCLCFISNTLRAETTPTAPSTTGDPKFTQPPPQQPKQPSKSDDRANNNGAAQAMGMVGAAIAGMSCMMMMKQAQEAQDPKEKQMMMMMAMQQCAQAAQSAASAAQNKENKKQLTQDDIPQQAQFQAPALAEAKGPADKEAKLEDLLKKEEKPEESVTPSEIKIEPFKPPPAPENKTADNGAGTLPGNTIPIPSTSQLKPIDKALITAKEDAKDGDQTSNPNANVAGLGGFGGGKPPSQDELKKAAADGALEIGVDGKPLRRARSAEPELGGGGGGDGGGSSSSGGAGGDPFDQMLSQLLGGGAGGGGEFGVSGQMSGELEVVQLPKEKKTGGPAINIFQYAGIRYGHLTHTDGRIKTQPKNLNRNTASVPNTVIQASVP